MKGVGPSSLWGVKEKESIGDSFKASCLTGGKVSGVTIRHRGIQRKIGFGVKKEYLSG